LQAAEEIIKKKRRGTSPQGVEQHNIHKTSLTLGRSAVKCTYRADRKSVGLNAPSANSSLQKSKWVKAGQETRWST